MIKYAIALTLALLLNAMANLMMKFGVIRFRDSGITMDQGAGPVATSLLSNWVLIVGLLCFATNVLFYTYALSGIKISIAYPIMVSGGFAIIAVVAWKFLGETMSPAQWAGVVFILAGVFLVARGMNSVSDSL
jgi:multidrug transporter EmrE-like cation transporter